jgi:hypothetical protein
MIFYSYLIKIDLNVIYAKDTMNYYSQPNNENNSILTPDSGF